LLAAGQAFFALSHEVSAHRSYTLSVGTLFPGQQEHVNEGLEQAVTDLEEAAQRWEGIVYLLDRVASERATSPDLVERIRPLVEGAYQQTARLSRLKANVFTQWAMLCQHDPAQAVSSPGSSGEERE
jgi:hypothetical protein